MALCFRLVLPDARRPTLDYFLPSQPYPAFRSGSASTFEGHSEASDVFARTFQGYPNPAGMSSGNRNFIGGFQLFSAVWIPASRGKKRNNPVRNSAIMANNQTPTKTGAEHSAPEPLKFTCSGLGLESGQPSIPGYRPQSNAWTALRRSLSKQLACCLQIVPDPYQSRATQSSRGAKQCFSCLSRIPHFRAAGNFGNFCEPHATTARQTTAKVRVPASAGAHNPGTVEKLWNTRAPVVSREGSAIGNGASTTGSAQTQNLPQSRAFDYERYEPTSFQRVALTVRRHRSRHG